MARQGKAVNRTEQNRTEQNRAEQNRTEQNGTERNGTEQNGTERGMEWNGTEFQYFRLENNSFLRATYVPLPKRVPALSEEYSIPQHARLICEKYPQKTHL